MKLYVLNEFAGLFKLVVIVFICMGSILFGVSYFAIHSDEVTKARRDLVNTSIDGYVSVNADMKRLHDDLLLQDKRFELDTLVLCDSLTQLQAELMYIDYKKQMQQTNNIHIYEANK